MSIKILLLRDAVLGMTEKTGTWLPKSEDQVLPIWLKDVKRGISHPSWQISL